MESITGRQKELNQLRKLGSKNSSSFVAIYGRRRVGKTFLVRNAFTEFAFQATGMANVNTKTQLTNFCLSLKRYEPGDHDRPVAKTWLEAFTRLIDLLENKDDPKKIIFLDELPWMDTAGSGFLPALEHFWNAWASARTDILLIVCGSAASWITNKLLNNRGGLHNRVTDRIPLYPFTLKELEEYFGNHSAIFDRYQLIQLYMAMGGIPFYLAQVDTGKSAAQNIDHLFFSTSGILRTEFDNLYHSLFQKAEKHIHIIEALSKKGRGLSRDELLQATKMTNGGGVTRILRELEESHFIRRYRSFGKKEKNSLYQLIDFYSLFYLRWLRETATPSPGYWLTQLNTPAQNAWEGIAFEKVCLEHVPQICDALGIAGIKSETSAWSGSHEEEGAQIDLLIDRDDRLINICEMKFSNDNYPISKSYADNLKKKLRVFKGATETKKALQLIFITPYGIVRNNYSDTLVHHELTAAALFR